MSKNKTAVFFSIIFLLFITAPTVITLVDDSIDISFIYSASEEEEKGNQKDKNIEIFFAQLQNNEVEFTTPKKVNHLRYYSKKYPKPHLNIVFPPPENL